MVMTNKITGKSKADLEIFVSVINEWVNLDIYMYQLILDLMSICIYT